MPPEAAGGPGGWIDLTRPLDATLPLYAEADYRDPPVRSRRWCSVGTRGFAVWQVELGSQSGTHIDAPAHFVAGGAPLEALDPGHLIGRYRLLRTGDLAEAPIIAGHGGEPILFLEASAHPEIAPGIFETLLALPCPVWVMAGEGQVAGCAPFHLHRRLAETGRFLIEDLDPGSIPRVPPRGEIVALPLKLQGTSGAPVRVLVRAIG